MNNSVDPRCAACGAALELEFPTSINQFDNALHIIFDGGYGEFVDAPFHHNARGYGPESLQVVICHDCAHRLCEQEPWIGEVIDPARSHTHRVGREH